MLRTDYIEREILQIDYREVKYPGSGGERVLRIFNEPVADIAHGLNISMIGIFDFTA